MHQLYSRILSNTKVSPTYYKMELYCPEVASEALPGQFVMARVSDRSDPLLRRPFAIHRIQRSNSTRERRSDASGIDILYKVVGKGTDIMSRMSEGDNVDLFGPLGNGYRIESTIGSIILVGGGVGVSSLLCLAEEIVLRCTGIKSMILFLGGKGRDDILCVEDFKRLGAEVRVTTEDGNLGSSGVVVNILSDYLESGSYSRVAYTQCFACGPESMLKEVARIAGKNRIPCQVSMESRMACGVGACQGCVVKTKSMVQSLKPHEILEIGDRQQITSYKRVCKDGPVFDSNEIVW